VKIAQFAVFNLTLTRTHQEMR